MVHKSLLLVILSLLGMSTAFGQGSVEIQPFIGYIGGGGIPVDANDLSVNKIKFDSSASYGVTLGYNATEYLGFEFLWNHQSTEAVAELRGGGQLDRTIDTSLNQYHGNFIAHFSGEDDALRPFMLVGLGATSASGEGSSETNFSFGVGGGLKYFVSQNIGFRVQGRYAPTYLFSEPGGYWCNWWGACWVSSNDKFLNQFDASAGVIFRF